MNMKVVLLFLLTLVILAPASIARPQYLTSLNTVYGNGSCSTCHVNASADGPRTSYGTLFENQPDHATNASAALIAIGAPPTTNPTPTATLTPEATPTPTLEVTTVSATATPKASGFGIVLSIIGLFALALLVKRNNK